MPTKLPSLFFPNVITVCIKYQHMLLKTYLLDIHVMELKTSFSESDQKSFDHTGKAVSICI